MKKFKQYDSNFDINKIEKDILSFWQDEDIFNQSIKNRDNNSNNDYIFYDGPPFANGLPHYGHLLTGYIKDIVARYMTMKGKKVERKFGWDTHGLPVEMETEKELNISGRSAIKEYGVDKFNHSCYESVMKYAFNWKEYVTRQGRWVDFDNSYKTCDLNYMESVLWAFKELYKKDLIYEDLRVVPYSWKCQTPLSNFETKMDNCYRKKTSKSVFVKFKLLANNYLNYNLDTYLLVWTTTPWTLPSNLAIAINKNITYIAVQIDNQEIIIIAKNTLDKLKKSLANYKIIEEITTDKLINLEYEPPFEDFSKLKEEHNNIFHIYHADFVNLEEGTGIVHIAPAFGEDDQELCKKHNILTICPVDDAGKFCDISISNKENKNIFLAISDFLKNKQVFETNDDIIKYLKSKNIWFKTEQYIHNYPHCWRTDTPLIYKAVSSYYVKVTALKDNLIAKNKEINWIPSHIKDGQFGKWLENARDWSITRNRFWGCPVPIWKSSDPKYPRIDIYGSIEELENDFKVKINNLHIHEIDKLTRINPDDPTGKSKMIRVSDVLDCWFESGSMPYAKSHYPFENKKYFENNFPADFITEYIAQTRGWFYTMFVLSVALFDKIPFKNVICHGTILDEKGQKLSKRLKNYQNPLDIFKKYGSDAMRLYLISTPIVKGQELKIDKNGEDIAKIYRLSIKPLINSYNFFSLYINIDNITPVLVDENYELNNVMDKYIMSKLKYTIHNIDINLSNYNLQNFSKYYNDFFDILNNWYIRRNRERFWSSDINQDKIDAYNILYTILYYITISSAPILPFLSEEIYQNLISVRNS